MSEITIQTHSGRFHADDVTAVSLLVNYYGERNVETHILRSRDPSTFPHSDILVDVGGEYDPLALRFDHHQQSCDETWNENTEIPLSSVGMIWKHFGSSIVTNYLNNQNIEHTDSDVDNLVDKLYFTIFQELDANDNGILSVKGGERKYWESLTVPSIVASCNSDNPQDDELQTRCFEKAMLMVSGILEIKFSDIIHHYFQYQRDLDEVEKRMDLSKEYIVVDIEIPTIYKCLSKLDPDYQIKFVIFNAYSRPEVTVKTRNRVGVPFINIVDICDENYLRKHLKNIDDLIFVHKNLFIAKAKTLETCIEIVEHSLKNDGIVNKVKKMGKSHPSIAGAALLGGLGLGYLYFTSNSD